MTNLPQTLFKLFSLPLLLLLSACFTSQTPLIAVSDADYPFQSIKYEFPGEDDQVTLVRTGDSYSAPEEEGDGKLLLKQIAENTYVMQIEYEDDGKPAYLYSVARLATDKKTIKLFKPFAEPSDLEALSTGQSGFKPCPSDPDIACVTDLDLYTKYALTRGENGAKTVNVLELN